MKEKWKLNTRLNHPVKPLIPEGNRPTISPIYQTAKFVLDEEHPYGDQFLYTRISNPSLRELEMLLSDIQMKEESIVFSSGIAAITGTLLGLLQSGDHVITFRELYKPARIFIRETLQKFNISSTVLTLEHLEGLESAIIPGKTKIIHFESPTNPNVMIADIQKIAQIAKQHNIILTMDGTFAGLHQHGNEPVDLMIQSLTKFGNGHGDVLAGSVSGSSELIKKIRAMSIFLGATLDPHAAFLISRGLKTYLLRYEKQTSNSQKIAEFLASHPKVKKVNYPGLVTHPGHDLAKKQMKDMGAVLSFEIDHSLGTATKFCHKVKLIQFAVSLGSTETLICPTLSFFGDDLSPQELSEMGINHYTLRLSVGLEDPEDIIQDLKSILG